MELEVKKAGDITLIKPLTQRIDVTVSTELKGKLSDLISHDGNVILLNLSQVNFIDSSGLGAIISIFKTLRLKEGNLAICNATPAISDLFRLTHMDKVFTIYKNEKEGVEALSKIKVKK